MNTPMGTRAPWRRVIALLASASFVFVACGGDGGEASSDTTTQSGAVTQPENPDADIEPVPGGTLRYGLEADTAQPWTPQNAACAISCHMVMRTVFDPLALPDENGDPKPYLAESITPNDDFTEWTIVPRAGVTFHDGTPLDAAAICTNINGHRSSILTGKALLNLAGDAAVNADGSGCVVSMQTPWPGFALYLTGQIGYIASPQWLGTVATDPTAAARPVGTGPFVFESYDPGGTFAANRNENYWRANEGLPYLQRIELRVFPEVQARVNALLDGEVDMIHVSNGDTIASLREQTSIEMIETDLYGETDYLLLNNRDPLLQDVRVRRALAHATDREMLSRERAGGVDPPANGPFSPTQIGYLEDTGYPDFDLAEATRLVQEYEAEVGPIVIQFDTTNDPFNRETNELIAATWESVGIEVNINVVEQGSYIIEALQGNFQIFGWRNHGGTHPDTQRVWWHSETGDLATNPLALNFGGINDPELDAQLDIIRGSTDDAEVQAAAEEINRIFGEQVYNLWTNWNVWGLAHTPAVHNVLAFSFPDGSSSIAGAGIAGTHQFVQMWIEQG